MEEPLCNREAVLLKEREGEVAILRLNRPEKANALNRDLFEALKAELDRMEWEDDVRAVIITGAGEKAFCAGIDLKERAGKNEKEMFIERERVIRPFYLALGSFPKPTIAALNGPAFGGGAELALTCDIRVASSGARFGQTEIKWGMIPSCGACQRLRLIAGMGVAKEIILTGRVLEAEECYRLGIYNRVVPMEKLMEEAVGLGKEISQHPAVAVKQAKRALEIGADISGALDFDFEASKECFFSGDALARSKRF
jgi:enoyl-CoA hydratase/carnithine racemase